MDTQAMNPDWKTMLAVAVGGAAGSVTRYLAAVYALSHQERWPGAPHFPWGTFAVNIMGAFLIGLLGYLCKESKSFSDLIWYLLATGFLGGLTTFSSLCFETLTLLRKDQYGMAVSYVGFSLVLGMAAVAAGFGIGLLIGPKAA